MSLRTALTTILYSLAALYLYDAIATLTHRRAATRHDVLTHYGTDHNTTPGTTHN
ncbi:hypothetical protein ABTW96_08645 [Nocardia beijingensis]|uniref:hypothetical protein n=1 Tax=Nocardia beijingensis TaxID=95162 RepID=UPI00331C75D7